MVGLNLSDSDVVGVGVGVGDGDGDGVGAGEGVGVGLGDGLGLGDGDGEGVGVGGGGVGVGEGVGFGVGVGVGGAWDNGFGKCRTRLLSESATIRLLCESAATCAGLQMPLELTAWLPLAPSEQAWAEKSLDASCPRTTFAVTLLGGLELSP